MGYMPDENMTVQDVEFFKIDEGTYDPKTAIWATDKLMNENNVRTMKLPSDIKPGTYVVRHEILALHYAFRGNEKTKTSGAQFYPICLKLKVLGDGTASPPGVKFPGGYLWNDPGILDNIYYGPNQYVSKVFFPFASECSSTVSIDISGTASIQWITRSTQRLTSSRY
jgi:cellulase